MDSQIRKAVLEDADAIARLAVQLGYEGQLEQTRLSLEAYLGHEGRFVFVAQSEEGRVVGWIGAKVDLEITSDPLLLVTGLVVDEAHRGRGIGRRLLDRAEELAISLQIPRIRLRMNEKRRDAFDFYTSLGFSETKRQVVFEKTV